MRRVRVGRVVGAVVRVVRGRARTRARHPGRRRSRSRHDPAHAARSASTSAMGTNESCSPKIASVGTDVGRGVERVALTRGLATLRASGPFRRTTPHGRTDRSPPPSTRTCRPCRSRGSTPPPRRRRRRDDRRPGSGRRSAPSSSRSFTCAMRAPTSERSTPAAWSRANGSGHSTANPWVASRRQMSSNRGRRPPMSGWTHQARTRHPLGSGVDRRDRTRRRHR